MELVIATNNKGKLYEIQAMLPGFILLTLEDIAFLDIIPEPYHSFEENALIKASTVFDFCGKQVLADDSGLCIEALHGAPGVISAHYAGMPPDPVKNVQKVLEEMEGEVNRKAFFKSVICLIRNDAPYFFEGLCHGTIAQQPEGSGGFGYDPIFYPDGFKETFGQLAPDIKNRLSHRGQAIRAMAEFLQTEEGNEL